MEIIKCNGNEPIAIGAYRLRYEVFAQELSFVFEQADAEKGLLKDPIDEIASIYSVYDSGAVISTIRFVHHAKFNSEITLPLAFKNLLGLDRFLPKYRDDITICSRLAVRPSKRGSISTIRLLSECYIDLLMHGTKFSFIWCQPYLIEMYTQLGFQIHASPVSMPQAHLTPMVLVMNDFSHLERIKSPLFRAASRAGLAGVTDESVAWFYETFANEIRKRTSNYDGSQIKNLIQYFFSTDRGKDVSPRILDGLDEDQCDRLLTFCKMVNFYPGETLIGKSQKAREMFIIMSGQVAVTLPRNDKIVRLGPGQCFGETALLLNIPRTADCVVEKEGSIAILSHLALDKLLISQPDLGNKLLLNLAKILSYRLNVANMDSLLSRQTLDDSEITQ